MISYPESSEARTGHTHAQLFTVQINCFVVEAVISVRCIYRKRRAAPCPFQFKLDRVLILIFSTTEHKFHSENSFHEGLFDIGMEVEYMNTTWSLRFYTIRLV